LPPLQGRQCPSAAGLEQAATWMVGSDQSACEDVCSSAGKVCNAKSEELQARVCSSEAMDFILKHMDVKAEPVSPSTSHGPCRFYSGSPFITFGQSVHKGFHFCSPEDGSEAFEGYHFDSWDDLLGQYHSSCTSPSKSSHSPICACQDAKVDISIGKQCSETPYTYDPDSKCDGWSGQTLDQCQAKCEDNEVPANCKAPPNVCKAFQFSSETGWCHLLSDCTSMSSRPDVTIGIIKN